MTGRRQCAFTLIETAAVLVLVGLMASAGALSLRSAYRGSQMEDVINRVKAIDHSARNLTQTSGLPGVIQIDRTKGSIKFIQDNQTHAGLLPVVLPNGFKIVEIKIATTDSPAAHIQIPCSALGQTPTYTLAIAGPKEQTRLLVFTGLTGQATELEDDASFDLDMLSQPRADTD